MNIPQRYIFLASLSGMMLTISFPKFGISWVSWFALIPLMISARKLDLKKSFFTGLTAGFVHYLSLLYWLSETMIVYGNISTLLSIPILILLSAVMALFVALFSAGLNKMDPHPAQYYIAIPCLWVALEYLRSILFTGFPWELLGYSQYKNLMLIQIADVSGVYGISYLIVLVNVTIYLTIIHFVQRNQKDKTIPKTTWNFFIAVTSIVFIGACCYGYFRVLQIDRISSESLHQKITVVQGNIDQAIKWNPEFQISTTHKYCDLSLSAFNEQPDLVVWPETATPFFYRTNQQLSNIVNETIRKMGCSFLIGSPSFKEETQNGPSFSGLYNSAYLISAEAKTVGKYDKAHLVPYGEYVPFKKWMPFLGKMVSQVGDYQKGKAGYTLPWKNSSQIGIQICYEIIFPSLSRNMVKNDAKLLVNITNDAWFGKSSAAYQHFSMAVFRAVENKRALVRAANTGISGYVDPKGKILETTELFREEVRTKKLPLLDIKTIYTEIGDIFSWICLFIASIFSIRGS